MTQYVIQIVGPVSGPPTPADGLYLQSYDPDAYNGDGNFTTAADPAEALRFPSLTAALAEWRRVSMARPVRPDGHPNRPLTAMSINVLPLPADGRPQGSIR